MRIGEVAGRSGVPIRTIRYYEDIGVLDAPRRTTSGYRDYDERVLDRLAFVRSAQTVGLTLGEIREIIAFRARGETPCAHVADLIAEHAADMSRRIAELERIKAELSRLARRARSLDPRDCQPSNVCHLIGRAGGLL